MKLSAAFMTVWLALSAGLSHATDYRLRSEPSLCSSIINCKNKYSGQMCAEENLPRNTVAAIWGQGARMVCYQVQIDGACRVLSVKACGS